MPGLGGGVGETRTGKRTLGIYLAMRDKELRV